MSELNPDNAKLEELISERFTVNNYLVKKDFHEKLLLRDENGNRIEFFSQFIFIMRRFIKTQGRTPVIPDVRPFGVRLLFPHSFQLTAFFLSSTKVR